jgi:predicted flavoprotein YhiN
MSWTWRLSRRNRRLISLTVNAIRPMSSGGYSSPLVGSTGEGAAVLACAAVTAQTARAAMVSTMWRASAV